MGQKPRTLRELTDEELKTKLESLNKEILSLRFEVRTGKIEKPSKIREAKRDKARIITIMKERATSSKAKEKVDQVDKQSERPQKS